MRRLPPLAAIRACEAVVGRNQCRITLDFPNACGALAQVNQKVGDLAGNAARMLEWRAKAAARERQKP